VAENSEEAQRDDDAEDRKRERTGMAAPARDRSCVLISNAVRRRQRPFIAAHAIGRSVSKPWAMPGIPRREAQSLDRTLR
jgi:hypothetical protein